MSVAGVLEQRGGDAREPAADRRDVKIKQVCCRGEGATKGSTRPFDRFNSNAAARGMGATQIFPLGAGGPPLPRKTAGAGPATAPREILAGVAAKSPRACPGDALGSGCHGFQAAVAHK